MQSQSNRNRMYILIFEILNQGKNILLHQMILFGKKEFNFFSVFLVRTFARFCFIIIFHCFLQFHYFFSNEHPISKHL